MTNVMLDTANAAAASGFGLKDLPGVLSAIAAIAAIALGYFANRATLRAAAANADAAAWQKANEAELKTIQDRLDGFYGPFRTMSAINRLMNRDLRDRQRDGDQFLLIEKLFDQAWRRNLPVGEVTLLDEIATNSKNLRTLIESNAGGVDEQIAPYLARVAAHYRMIELAHDNKLGDEAAPYVARYVFPRQIEDVLRLEVARLERRRAWLKAHPFAAPPPMESLEIPAKLALPEWPNPPRAPRPELNMPLS